jgi:hypothetical protein
LKRSDKIERSDKMHKILEQIFEIIIDIFMWMYDSLKFAITPVRERTQGLGEFIKKTKEEVANLREPTRAKHNAELMKEMEQQLASLDYATLITPDYSSIELDPISEWISIRGSDYITRFKGLQKDEIWYAVNHSAIYNKIPNMWIGICNEQIVVMAEHEQGIMNWMEKTCNPDDRWVHVCQVTKFV